MYRNRFIALVLFLLPSLATAQTPRRYTLSVTGLTAAAMKLDGRLWDGGIAFAKPDPVVRFNRVDGAMTKKRNALLNEQQQLTILKQRAEQPAQLGRQLPKPAPFTPAQAKRLDDVTAQLAQLHAEHFANTEVLQDTLDATLQEGSLTVNIGDQIYFDVWDKDVIVDDGMGSLRITITEAMVRNGSATLKFGSVKALTIKFAANK